MRGVRCMRGYFAWICLTLTDLLKRHDDARVMGDFMKYNLLLTTLLAFGARGAFALDLTYNPRELEGTYVGRQTGNPRKFCKATTKRLVPDGPGFDDNTLAKVSVDLTYLSVQYSQKYLYLKSIESFGSTKIAQLYTDSINHRNGNTTLASGNFGPQHASTVSTNMVTWYSIVSHYSDKNFELAMWAIPYSTWNTEDISLTVNPKNTNEFRLKMALSSSSPRSSDLRGKQSLDCTFTRQ